MTTREERREIISISTATKIIELSEGQYFCTTPKAYELWQEEPLRFLKRWDRRRVFFVWER